MTRNTLKHFSFKTSNDHLLAVMEGIRKHDRSRFIEKVLVKFITSEEGKSVVDFVGVNRSVKNNRGTLSPKTNSTEKTHKKNTKKVVVETVKQRENLKTGFDNAAGSRIKQTAGSSDGGSVPADILGDFVEE